LRLKLEKVVTTLVKSKNVENRGGMRCVGEAVSGACILEWVSHRWHFNTNAYKHTTDFRRSFVSAKSIIILCFFPRLFIFCFNRQIDRLDWIFFFSVDYQLSYFLSFSLRCARLHTNQPWLVSYRCFFFDSLLSFIIYLFPRLPFPCLGRKIYRL
jgi:hypothetical protein